MKHVCFRKLFLLFWLIIQTSLLCSCSKNTNDTIGSSDSFFSYKSGKTSVLEPTAPGTDTYGDDLLLLDFSNCNQGYFIGSLSQNDHKVNIQVTGPDQIIYKYFLNTADSSVVFPFTAGSGDYIIVAYENIGADQYVSLFSHSLNVKLENEFLPFLYPNQYVDFTSDNYAVQLAGQISENEETDLDALNAVYHYITSNITYDYEKAETVEAGYLPDIDETLHSGTGICFDFAAVTAAMLRSLSIPARLSIGYSGDVHHAWVDVYIQSMGWIEKALEFKGNEWKYLDPTYASALGSTDAAKEYTGDGSSYILQYVR